MRLSSVNLLLFLIFKVRIYTFIIRNLFIRPGVIVINSNSNSNSSNKLLFEVIDPRPAIYSFLNVF